MDGIAFDALTRRASFAALGAPGLTLFARTFAASAKKKKRRKKRGNGNPNELCKKQVGQCVDFFTPRCDGDPTCLAAFEGCCSILGNCSLTGFFSCFGSLG